MATFKEFTSDDLKTDRDVLEQLVDILQNDISGSTTRRKYQHWVTGGVGPGVTSSLWQTVFDQDFTLQTANPIFDVTFGLSANSTLVNTGSLTFIDTTTDKYFFSSQSLMMREKMDIYRLFAQNCLGNADDEFELVSGSTTTTIREPLFIAFKRLFSRDRDKRETFGIKLYKTGSNQPLVAGGNLNIDAVSASIYTDVGSSTNIQQSFGGQVSTIVDSANTSVPIGLLFIDKGIAVLDTQQIFDSAAGVSLGLSGSIHAMNSTGFTRFSGSLNKFLVSGSVDDVLDHICSTRFSSSNQTAIAFQNQTYINSTLFFCRFAADEFNYSSNPTYVDSDTRIIVIDPGQEETQRSFTFITSVGLYDAHDNLLGVAKASRPIFKDNQRDFTLKVRLDY